ncbi:MAG TPA: VirB3 family type IV secretion system protein [Candidatus Angelobacter sp.]|nr:VirB3 family type IV secretion system protein [Candidatus Angelobacter sp.]
MQKRRIHFVYKAVNKPLTVLGAERRLFFSALIMGGAAFNLFGSLLSGLVLFLAMLLAAQSATNRDPQLLRILLNSTKFKKQYDPLKFHNANIQVVSHA